MEYKFTFEDGSEAYLAHYGVKGMKWKNRKSPVVEEELHEQRRRKAKALGNKLTKKSAKAARAKVKAYFSADSLKNVDARSAAAIRKGRKLRGVHGSFMVNKDGSVTSTLERDRHSW